METFLSYAFKGGENTFIADGIMVTHPDADHIQGVVKLLKKFPPNQEPKPGKPKFEFSGPLLLTKAFEADSYEDYMNVIKDVNFKKDATLASGDPINGFESLFTFFYPEDAYPGTLYKYDAPVKSRLMARLLVRRYSPASLHPNPSSILLVVNDPDVTKTDPLVSLNGDGLGHSILKSLNKKHPKVFKVPHHGSVHNSIALKEFEPDDVKLTAQLLATQVLLERAINGKIDVMSAEFIDRLSKKFDAKIEDLSQGAETRKRKRGTDISFTKNIEDVAKDFKKNLQNVEAVNVANLLTILTDRSETIKKKISLVTSLDDAKTDLYTSGLTPLPADFSVAVYKKAKSKVIEDQAASTVIGQREVYDEIFNLLESDLLFGEELAFRLIRAFYNEIKANTYFVSAGFMHGHPTWEIVNGIIAAAHDQHKNDPTYKCRLLLTSGNNIKGNKIQELYSLGGPSILTDDWTKYVSLQYFAGDTPSVVIDPNEADPTVLLAGTIQWDSTKKDEELYKLLSDYNSTKGAQELKKLRAVNTGMFEIKPFGEASQWLEMQPAAGGDINFGLSNTKVGIKANDIETFSKKPCLGIVFEFKQTSPAVVIAKVNGILGTHPPTSSIKTCLLYIVKNKKEKYFKASGGGISFVSFNEDPTFFQFFEIPAAGPVQRMIHSLFAPRFAKYESFLLRRARAVSDISSESSSTMSLKDFLVFIHHSENTIHCQDLLEIVISQEFPSQILSSLPSNSTLKQFITKAFGFLADNTSSFVVQGSKVISANIRLVLPSEQLNLNTYMITEVGFIVNDPKTDNEKVTMDLYTNDSGISLTLTYHLEGGEATVQSFQEYLLSLGITKSPSTFNMYDVIITLLKSEMNSYAYLTSLSQKIVGLLLEWSINEEESIVEFSPFPTGTVVTSADIVAQIPPSGASFDLGLSNALSLSKIHFVLPDQLESSEAMYLAATATVDGIEVNIVCHQAVNDELPEVKVSLAEPVGLDRIVNLLQLGSIGISNFAVPLMSKALKDVEITEAGFACRQGVQNLQQTYLSKVFFGVTFTNLDSYLPSSCSSLKSISAHVAVYQPKLSFIQIAMEISFSFEIEVTQGNSIPLTAQFATKPVNTDSDTQSSYDFTVSIEAGSNIIGTTKGGISLDDFLGAFGLGGAITAAKAIPFLHSLLQKVELKHLLLGMNTSSKSITSFGIELYIFDWNIVPDKVAINQAEISMYYIENKWNASFCATATFGDYFPVTINFELPNTDEPASFTFTSSNYDFTIAKFLEIFGLGSMDGVPVVGQFLSIAVTKASLKISKTDGSIKVNEGKVSLYAQSISIGSIFTLSKVNATIGFVFDPDQNKYNFRFAVSGFINKKLYISVEYDNYTSILSGQLSIASFEEANLSDVLVSLIKGTDSVNKNVAFKEVSQSPSVNLQIALQYNSGEFKLKDLIIDLEKVMSIGSVSLERLRFEYNYIAGDDSGVTPSQQLYKLIGELTSQKNSIGAILEFDLTIDSTGNNSVTATLKPSAKKSLTLRSILSLLGISALPSVPTVEGQELPPFFDLAFTNGSITLSVPSFSIEAFTIEVETTNEVTIFDSPVIKLKQISLKVNYNKDSTPTTTAMITGIFSIGGVQITLQGIKQSDCTVFKVAAKSDQDNVHLQQSINTLTPTGKASPAIPSDIGIPKQLQVLVAELIVKYATDEKSVLFSGNSQLDWTIDLGFQHLTVKQVGGKVSYKKSTNQQSPPPSPQYAVYVTGQFQFSHSILMSSELHFGQNIDTVLSILVSDSKQVAIPSVTDDLLGFSKSQDGTGVGFESLLPNTTQNIQFFKAFLNVNFTQKAFALFGELTSIGSGFLFAANFSSTSTSKYGYAFGISLPQGFKFSNLLSALSPIDDILTIHKANCMIVSIDNVKVTDVVSKMKKASQSAILPIGQQVDFPFTNVVLDDFTKGQNIVSGLSIYCELDFNSLEKGSLFSSMIQISNDPAVPTVIISSFISKDPTNSVFKASITNLTLLGAFHFSKIALVYRPASQTSFELNGTVAVNIGDTEFDFIGQFVCTNVKSEFSVSTGNEIDIGNPLGMFGIKLEKVQLSMLYNYPKDQARTSSQSLSGTVNFYSTPPQSSTPSQPSSTPPPAQPSVVLKGMLLFDNCSPTVVRIVLETTTPLTIGDLVATIFRGSFDTAKYINIGFVKGQVYYAKLANGQNSTIIDGVTYKNGYHISADIEIFTKEFTIEADILPDESKVSVEGFAHAPLDLGFAKFTGTDEKDPSKPDESKSPEIIFSTNPQSTSISLKVGFILFQVPIGASEIGYKNENGIKKFFGQLTYHGNIGFMQNPSIGFEWSKQNGFKVTNWPAAGALTDAFDFFSKLKNYGAGSKCGALVDLAFKESVQSKFDINVKLSKATDPTNFFADIEITGTYNVLLASTVKIASVPLPDIKVGIPRQDSFTLSDIPQFILKLFSDNADSIVKQIIDHPDRLAKIIGLSVLKTVTKKVLNTLLCRNVSKDSLDGDIDDNTDDDFDNADEAEEDFNDDFDSFEDAFGDGLGDLGKAAAAAAEAVASGEGAAGIFAGLIGFFAGLLAVFGISSSKADRAKAGKSRIDNKINQIKQKMSSALDIKNAPQARFTPPNKLSASWNSIKGANYHVKVMAIPIDEEHLGQKTAVPVLLYEHTSSTNSLSLTDERLYNYVGLKVSVNGTIQGSSGGKTYTYNGKVYTVDVPNVHPTLHPPSNLQITYHHVSCQISVTASQVQYAKNYYFELLDNNNDSLSHYTYTPPPSTTQIQCSFPQSAIEESSVAPFKVRGQSIGPSGSGIASSVSVTSNTLSIVSPVTDLELTLPHFMEQNQTVDFKWKLPASTQNIKGFVCQVFEDKSSTVVLSKKFFSTPLLTTGSLEMSDLVAALNNLNLVPDQPNNSVQLKMQVSSSSNSDQIIDSVFVGKLVSSLQSPQQVSFKFSSEKNALQICWKFTQQTSDYGLEIRGPSTNLVWSKKVTVAQDPDIEEGKVGSNIPLSELKSVNDPNIQYTVQVISIASGNDTLDCLVATRAASALQVLSAPVLDKLTYIQQSDSVAVSFQSVTNASKYLICLFKSTLEAVSSQSVSYQPTITVPVDSFVDKLLSKDSVKGSVQPLGTLSYLSSSDATFTNSLTTLPQPTGLTYTYNEANKTITITCTPAQAVQTYKFGFLDTSDVSADVTKVVTSASNTVTSTFSTNSFINSNTHQWKGFVQSVLASDSDSQLPSSHLYLSQEVIVLDAPSIKSLQLSDPYTVLKISLAAAVDNANNYQIKCSLYDSNQTVLKEISKQFPTSQTGEMSINLPQEISNWESIRLNSLSKLTITVTAGGSGYYVTSKPSQPMSIVKSLPPSNLQSQYSTTEDTLKILFQAEPSDSTAKVNVGLSGVGSSKEISREANATAGKVVFTGKEIRDQDTVEWTAHVQMLGSIPSSVETISDHVYVLSKPQIQSMSYDVSSTVVSFTWSAVAHASSYRATIGYELNDGTKNSLSKQISSGTSATVTMKNEVSNWSQVSNNSGMTLTLTAIGPEGGTYITSNPSEIYSITPQFVYNTNSFESSVMIEWSRVYGNRTITINGGYALLTRSVADPNYTTIPKRLFLYPTTDPEIKDITISVAGESAGYPSAKNIEVQKQQLQDSGILGCNTGEHFNDRDKTLDSQIVGIKRLVIKYGDSIDSLQATYNLNSGTDHSAPSHGGENTNQATIDFDDQEYIIAVRASSSKDTHLSKLVMVTQKVDGSFTRYGPFGTATPSPDSNVPIMFSGNAIIMKGMKTQDFVNNLGFHYTYASPTISVSQLFGGNGGDVFDHDALTHVPQVVRVKSIYLQYDSLSLISIQPTYLLYDGNTWQPDKRGGIGYSQVKHPVSLSFEEGEDLIGIAGKTAYDGRIPSPSIDVNQLTLTTQKNGIIKEYGPYGKSSVENGSTFIVRGKILGFHGRSGWLIDALGAYYSLERTELLGGTGGNSFDDGKRSGPPIVGIKKLNIRYFNVQIISFQAEYILSNGSTWQGPLHPSRTVGTLKTIELEDGEDVVSMVVGGYRSDSSSDYTVGYLEFMTQKKDGIRKEYDRIGTVSSFGDCKETEFTAGRIVSFFGRSSLVLNAIGASYIQIPSPITTPIVSTAKTPSFGGNGGGVFDDNILTHSPPVLCVKSINLQYDSCSLVSFQPTYLLDDGDTLQSAKRGGIGYSQVMYPVSLSFEDGEDLIGIAGKTAYDGRVPNTDVNQLTLITQKNGIIKEYGPYGKSSVDDGTTFIVRGKILGFHGRSGNLVDALGAYYSLERTNSFGGTGGQKFVDVHSSQVIVGIRSLHIRHSDIINSLQAEYLLSDGSKWQGSIHGSDQEGTLESLQFEDGEEITSMKVLLSGYIVGGLEVKTQKRDGTTKTYQHLGSTGDGRQHVITGRLISFVGRSGSSLIAIGASYIPIN